MPKGDKWHRSNGKVGLCNEFQGFLEMKRTPADTAEDNCYFRGLVGKRKTIKLYLKHKKYEKE